MMKQMGAVSANELEETIKYLNECIAGKGQKMQRFNARTERIVALLKKADEIILPKCVARICPLVSDHNCSGRLDIIDWVTRYAEAQHAQALANAAAEGALGSGIDGVSAANSYEGLKIAGINGTGAPTASKVSVEIIDMDEKEQLRRRIEKEREGELRRYIGLHPSALPGLTRPFSSLGSKMRFPRGIRTVL